MRIERHPIAEIHESAYNPRISLDPASAEYKAIRQSISDYGFVEPIVVNDINMSCVGGHQRLAVMRDMGEKEIDCVMVHIDDPDKEKALCVALNKIKGEWDEDKLNELLDDEAIREFETGFEDGIYVHEDDYGFPGEDDEEDIDGDEPDMGDAPSSDDDIAEAAMVIKVGNYHFDTTTDEYEEMIGRIRDKGIFEKSEVIEELRRKLHSD